MRREVVLFVTIGFAALVAVGTGTYFLSGEVARATALRSAEASAARIASYLVEPLLVAVLAGEAGARRELDELVATGAGDDALTAVIVWRDDGTIVYATDPALAEQRLTLTPELTAAVDGRVVSGLDPQPEVAGEGWDARPHLEVYTPLRPTGQDRAYVLEAYFDAAMIDREATILRTRVVPVAIGALVLLQAAQIPIAVSLARRLTRHEGERTRLVERSLARSDRERREIAADIHDGPVQDLAGVSYALNALLPVLPEGHAARAGRLIDAVRSAIGSLRHLMVDIYPPDLSGPGLAMAVEHLADRLREQGLIVHVERDALPETAPRTTAVLYRSAKEALGNVGSHACARTVWVGLEKAARDGRPAVRLTVADDGVGFPVPRPGDRRQAPRGRNFGLQFLRYRVIRAGGAVTFRNREDGGAVVDVLLPADGADGAVRGSR